jgi:uncharacterized membrane protein YdjX (TVP38/TMEM64 family)
MNRPIIILLIVSTALAVAYYVAHQTGWIDMILNPEILKTAVRDAGLSGVLIIIGLMVFAIVFNPIPSAPIALVSGAVYGHAWGTLYIVIGAQVGAMVAFSIARMAGRNLVCRLLGKHRFPTWLGSQRAMTTTVFLSRLAPFISFDLISYGAGLTNIKPWLFSVATLFGLLPASFLLAHFGQEMTNNIDGVMMQFILISGVIILIPLLLKTYAWRKTGHSVE